MTLHCAPDDEQDRLRSQAPRAPTPNLDRGHRPGTSRPRPSTPVSRAIGDLIQQRRAVGRQPVSLRRCRAPFRLAAASAKMALGSRPVAMSAFCRADSGLHTTSLTSVGIWWVGCRPTDTRPTVRRTEGLSVSVSPLTSTRTSAGTRFTAAATPDLSPAAQYRRHPPWGHGRQHVPWGKPVAYGVQIVDQDAAIPSMARIDATATFSCSAGDRRSLLWSGAARASATTAARSCDLHRVRD
jgi:hypothetical protein